MSMQMHEYRGVPQEAPTPAPPTIVRSSKSVKHAEQEDVTGGWMSIPIGIPNCPVGLEYLTALDEVFIQRDGNKSQSLTAIEPNTMVRNVINRYCLKNGQDQQVYLALELGNRWKQRFLGTKRPLHIQIVDNFQNVVLQFVRPLRCTGCLFPGCLQEMFVSSPPGTTIGSVQQMWSPVRSKYVLKNQRGEAMLTLVGPLPTFMSCMRNVQYRIITVNGNDIGTLSRDCDGPMKGSSTDAEYFGVTFPMDIDARMKAVLVGASFLIGLTHFDK